jgi:hypothetical protein
VTHTTSHGPQWTHAMGQEGWTPRPSLSETLDVDTDYDNMGRPTMVRRESYTGDNLFAALQSTSFTYDLAGRKVQEQTGRQRAQQWAYNNAGNVNRLDHPARIPDHVELRRNEPADTPDRAGHVDGGHLRGRAVHVRLPAVSAVPQ